VGKGVKCGRWKPTTLSDNMPPIAILGKELHYEGCDYDPRLPEKIPALY
jgi:hypothetical protein